MSKWQNQHPEDGLLLRYLDGELKGRQARQVKRHLESCWQCRAELETMQSVASECVHYRKQVLEAHLPPPPHAWPDIYAGFARVDASLAGEPLLARLRRA